MVKRKRIGLVYGYDSNWIGGTYYIENIIKAVQLLPEEKKPELTIFYRDEISLDQVKKIEATNVKYVKVIPISKNIVIRIINKIARLFGGQNIIVPTYSEQLPDSVYPYIDNLCMINEKVNWITDFQDHYLPEMFSKSELQQRKQDRDLIGQHKWKVVFSSQSAMQDYKKFYRHDLNDCKVLNFACVQPDYSDLNIGLLKEKFKITTPYFFVPNQFWKHKNHRIIIEAMHLIKQENRNKNFCMVFTGKEHDYRNKDYFASLKNLVEEYSLTNEIKFLGFIDRREQLQLMNHALAVIQPSLFEGWSTVVEDAKSMNQFLIVSDINVHHEQVLTNALFFLPTDAKKLKEQIYTVLEGNVTREKKDYNQNIKKFAIDFINIFD